MLKVIKSLVRSVAHTLVLICLSAGIVHAQLKIDLKPLVVGSQFVSRNQTITVGVAPDDVRGGGNIDVIMRIAAGAWQKTFNDVQGQWRVKINYGWCDVMPYGQEFVIKTVPARGNQAARITEANVCFRDIPASGDAISDGQNPEIIGSRDSFFADPIPWTNNSFGRVQSYWDSTFSKLNVGRVLENAKGYAIGRIDLFSIAMHEIGHALGIDFDYPDWSQRCVTGDNAGCDLDITTGRPFANRYSILVSFVGPHINSGSYVDGAGLDTPLMVSDPFPGRRVLISDLDALAIAQINLLKGFRVKSASLAPEFPPFVK